MLSQVFILEQQNLIVLEGKKNSTCKSYSPVLLPLTNGQLL